MKARKQENIRLYNISLMPTEIKPISKKWTDLSNAHGDSGSCVLGACFEFSYHGTNYELPPLCMWQGSCAWEPYVEEIRKDLIFIGCENVRYNWGNMD
jgi:hypothetical protein